MDNLLSFLGLVRKAGKLAIGEEPVGASCRARHCRVLFLAQDAAAPTARRAKHFSEVGQCLLIQLPFDKDALGRALGRSSCAMLAVEDIGFADALVRRLAADDPQYADASERLQIKAQRAAERRREQLQHEKNLRLGRCVKRTPAPKKETKTPAPSETADAAPGSRTQKPCTKTDKPYARSGSRSVRKGTENRFAGSRPVKKGKGSACSKSV